MRAGAIVGPYARLRPGADIGPGAHIGNFVEVKKVTVGAGAKANHLAYLGDGTVGAGRQHRRRAPSSATTMASTNTRPTMGEGAFIGSNTALVAPVRVGAGAYTGSGSVITKDVAPDALALGRGAQVEKPGWAAAFRARKRPRGRAQAMTPDEQKRAAGEARRGAGRRRHDRGPRHRLHRGLFVKALAARAAGPQLRCVATSQARPRLPARSA